MTITSVAAHQPSLRCFQSQLRRKNMPIRFGPTELLIILGIVVLLFGVGRVSRISAELGKGIRAFRDGLNGSGEKTAVADKK
jgi:sec-independent protein translocase protein TatA